MSKGIRVKEETIIKIIGLHSAGKSIREISIILGMGYSTVSRYLRCYKALIANDVPEIIDCIYSGCISTIKSTAEVLGKPLPKQVLDAMANQKPYQVSEKHEEKHLEVEEIVQEKKTATNEDIYLVKVLESLNKTNEFLEQLMDVVIPKYVCDIKDNMNANCDIATERLKISNDKLEKIAINTRKRGI